jgi:hypothetical protein
VVGGRDSNGAPLYITRVKYDGGVHVAKAGEHLPGAHLAFSGKEVIVNVSNKLIVWSARSVLTCWLQEYEVLYLKVIV